MHWIWRKSSTRFYFATLTSKTKMWSVLSMVFFYFVVENNQGILKVTKNEIYIANLRKIVCAPFLRYPLSISLRFSIDRFRFPISRLKNLENSSAYLLGTTYNVCSFFCFEDMSVKKFQIHSNTHTYIRIDQFLKPILLDSGVIRNF